MSIYTVILLTGTLNTSGEPVDIERTTIRERFDDEVSCHRRGSALAARKARDTFGSTRTKSHRRHEDAAVPVGTYVGYLCEEQRQTAGVVLYEHAGFRGDSERFTESDRDLGNNRIGRNQAQSVEVSPGCTVQLFAGRRFKGRHVTLTENVFNLGSTAVGNKEVSSLKVDCESYDGHYNAPGHRPQSGRSGGVTLFEHSRFKGQAETFVRDDADLRDNPIGSDRASSVHVTEGCTAVLYSEIGFRGNWIEINRNVSQLGDTTFGADQARSIRVLCHEQQYGPFFW